jgi:hypothetical protein
VPKPHVPPQLTVGPFTTHEAERFGLSRKALQSGPWRHVFRDVWIHEDIPDSHTVRVAAVRLVMSDGYLCGHTAAYVYKIDVPDPKSDLVWVAYPPGARLRARPGTLVKELAVDAGDVQVWGGVRITTELRTAFDCGRWLSLIDAVVVADYFAHQGKITAATLAAYTHDHRGLRGIKQLDRVIGLIEPRTESPMETRLRLLLNFAGLTGFEPQYEVFKGGKLVGRVDFAFVTERVIVEYDGSHHWQQRRDDDRRRDAIRALG